MGRKGAGPKRLAQKGRQLDSGLAVGGATVADKAGQGRAGVRDCRRRLLKSGGGGADTRGMEGLFSIVGTFLGGLFVVAVAVAWWEHLRDQARPVPRPPETHKAAHVDVDVAALAAPTGDAGERQRALQGVLSRVSSESAPWAETTPTVAPGTLGPRETAPGKL